jgi:hypothetical protein
MLRTYNALRRSYLLEALVPLNKVQTTVGKHMRLNAATHCARSQEDSAKPPTTANSTHVDRHRSIDLSEPVANVSGTIRAVSTRCIDWQFALAWLACHFSPLY